MRRLVPVVLQATVTDCGPACLAMVLAHHGRAVPLAVLREAHEPVPGERLALAWPEETQRDRCLHTLVVDGLVEPLDGDRYRQEGSSAWRTSHP